jgi:lysophospholipase
VDTVGGAVVEEQTGARSPAFARLPEGLAFDWLEAGDDLRLRFAVARAEGRPRGTTLLLPGRTEYIEKYYETIADLLERRLDVFVLDWRGQGLSARLIPHSRRGYVRAFDDYLADLGLFVDEVLSRRARTQVHLLAHSMGGHLALRFLHDRPDAVERAVLTAPMVDIRHRVVPRRMVRLAVETALRLGLHAHYIPGHGDRGALGCAFERNRLTGCRARFETMKALIEENEGVALGGVTYQWLKAALDSIALVARPGFAEAIRTPVLVVSAGLDRVVCNLAQAKLASRLPQGRLVVLPDARHEILMERDTVRAHFLEELDTFLAEPG